MILLFRHLRFFRVWVVVLVFLSWREGSAATFTSLPGIPGLVGGALDVRDISHDGTVVVGDRLPGSFAFRWTEATGSQIVGSLTTRSEAYAASDVGFVVGRAYLPASFGQTRSAAVRWTPSGEMQELGPALMPPTGSLALGVSADGNAVVGLGYFNGTQVQEAFLWTPESGMKPLGFVSSEPSLSTAFAISADGKVVVGESHTNAGRVSAPFRWSEETGMVSLGYIPGGNDAVAYDVSSDGNAVVGKSNTSSGLEAFRWTPQGGMVGLGRIPGAFGFNPSSEAFSVTDDGRWIFGRATSVTGATVAAIWDEDHGMRDLRDVLMTEYGLHDELAGWTLTTAHVSGDGLVIAGSGDGPDNEMAWRVLLPEPSSSCVFALYLVGIALNWRHRRA